MSAHTPGPWIYHSGMVWKPDDSANGIPIARMDRDTPATQPTERDANACLIAASPDLLEALEDMCEMAQLVDDNWEQGNIGVVVQNLLRHRQEALATIAKAVAS